MVQHLMYLQWSPKADMHLRKLTEISSTFLIYNLKYGRESILLKIKKMEWAQNF